MKFNNSLVLSTVALALMATGCVKKQDNVTPSGTYGTSTTATTIYDTTGTGNATYNPTNPTTTNYETASPLIYDTGSGAVNGGTTYTEIIPDNTVITTTNSGSTYGSGEIIDNYSDTQSSGAFSTNGSGESSSYSYGGYSGTDYSSSTANSSRSTSSSSPSSGGGIHLQVAALKDYYAAEEFKNSLSLDPKYSAYIQRGALNKVIITGISSVNEANMLKERRFPGAFIVRNSGSSSSSSSYGSTGSSSYGSSSNYNASYTDNSSAYGSYNSSSSSSSSRGVSGSVGVQIGAFSNRGKAQSVADANSGQYTAIVEQGTSRGRTVYRVILTGFSSRSDAKRALSSGRISNGFVTTVH
jgi:cell division septation protein DedD